VGKKTRHIEQHEYIFSASTQKNERQESIPGPVLREKRGGLADSHNEWQSNCPFVRRAM
jgi:hypothetical protein